MDEKPREPKAAPTSKSGLKEGDGAPPPQSDPKHGGQAKRPVQEEDVFGGAERTHTSDVRSSRAKP